MPRGPVPRPDFSRDPAQPIWIGSVGTLRTRVGGSIPWEKRAPNEFGLYDVLGNVWEWVEDSWHGNYEGAPTDGLPWVDTGASDRVVRGGSWGVGAGLARAACRDGDDPGSRIVDLGFRLARGPEQE